MKATNQLNVFRMRLVMHDACLLFVASTNPSLVANSQLRKATQEVFFWKRTAQEVSNA